ncbi:MAG TPA: DUF2283 domain-containing protein [Candidatus Binatia bacterium]|nr:DUF2283 domain-containing protein [Candidatus Binatia bacterium]
MKCPLTVEIDFEAPAAYIYYQEPDSAKLVETARLGLEVAADLDANGDVIGLELWGFDEEAISTAEEFAHSKGCSFPRNLGAALALA